MGGVLTGREPGAFRACTSGSEEFRLAMRYWSMRAKTIRNEGRKQR